MSDTLKLLVIHPHNGLYPGDILKDVPRDKYEELVSQHPFPYYSILEGAYNPNEGRSMGVPLEDSLPLAVDVGQAAERELERIESLTAKPSAVLGEALERELPSEAVQADESLIAKDIEGAPLEDIPLEEEVEAPAEEVIPAEKPAPEEVKKKPSTRKK